MVSLSVCPVTLTEARAFVGKHHRHNLPPQGWLFGVGLTDGQQLRGVAIAGRPVARRLDDGATIEVTRVCTDGVENGCSMLYGAITRAAKALGYRRAITYTLQSESGASLKASNWRIDAALDARPSWSVPSRPRVQVDLSGNRASGGRVIFNNSPSNQIPSGFSA